MAYGPKPCEKCGDDFIPNSGVQKWCSTCKTPTCAHCGETFQDPHGTRGTKYCSRKCYQLGRWGSRSFKRPCAICGTLLTTFPSLDRQTCSRACRWKLKSMEQRGERSHFWRGGATAPYVNDWKEQRRAALARDGHQCASCGSRLLLTVHHIEPHRWSQTHALENLITLCRSCHSREELKVNPPMADGLKQRWPRQREETAA